MRTVFLCHARQDSHIAQGIAEFLVRGADVRFFIEDGRIDSPAELIGKISEGQTADVILILLSPNSTPPKWVREEWQPAIFDEPDQAGIPVGILLAEACNFPALLRRKNFFDISDGTLKPLRDLRRWLLGIGRERTAPTAVPILEPESAELDELAETLADAPGSAQASLNDAVAFVRAYWRDFDSVHWLHCASRPFVSIAGELGAALGIYPRGELEDNLDQLREHCQTNRPLIIFDGITPSLLQQLAPGGRSSCIAIPPEHLRKSVGPTKLHRAAAVCAQAGFRWSLVEQIAGKPGTLDDQQFIQLDRLGRVRLRKPSIPEEPLVMPHARAVWNRFRGWVNDEQGCLADLPDLEVAVDRCLARASLAEAWTLACELSRTAYLLTRKHNRFAEAFHWMNQISQVAMRKGDKAMLEESAREARWILENWNRPPYIAAADTRAEEQMTLF